MSAIFFWKNWPRTYQRIWFALTGIFILSLLFLWYAYLQGADGIIRWQKIQEQEIIETTVHTFQLGAFKLRVPAESYVIFEYLQGSDPHHNVIASCIFLIVLVICAMMLLTLITTLERFWFLSGMSLFILFVVSLRLDMLHLFGMQGIAVPAAVLLVFIATGFYFRSIKPDTGFSARLLTFCSLAFITGIVIYFFSDVPFPILQVAIAAYVPALILSILFIIMVAHEIPAAFVYIVSQGGTKNLRHFLIITAIYLINILITSLHEIGYLAWDFVYINLYLLLTISSLLGLWGFRLRENLYGNIFAFAPFGAYFFVALGTICMITVAQLLGNANDATLEVIRDLIAFTHAAFGIVFLIYFISNFMVIMAQGLPVNKVLYKPSRMPYFTFRFAGIIVTLAFVFASYWRDYVYHSMAGFYNYVADLYALEGNDTYSSAFYERSRSLAYQNHRANYALAMMKASRFDFDEAFENFELANGKHPSDFSLVNEGNLHLWRKEYFPAIKIFKTAEAARSFPALHNNLGFAYAKVHRVDSAIHYISAASKDHLTKASAETNFFAFAAKEYLPVKTDSILRLFNSTSPGVMANAVAAATLFKQNITIDNDLLADSVLNLYSATLLNNYIIKNAQKLDTAFTSRVLDIATDGRNNAFSEALKASLAHAFYHQGNVHKAQQILGELAYLSQSYRGKYNYIMGLWALEQGGAEMAHKYFIHAAEADFMQAQLYHAIALTESDNLHEAHIAWDSLMLYGDEAEKAMATQINYILTRKPEEALSLNDAEKYQYARYKVSADDTLFFSTLVNRFKNTDYKALTLLDMSKKQLEHDRIKTAIHFFNQISGLALTDKKLYDDIRFFELRMLASRNEVRNLVTQINKGISFDNTHFLEKLLYTALISEANGDIATAERNYNLLGVWNPYFEEGIIAAADFFRRQDEESPKPYNILAEAIQVNAKDTRLLKEYMEEAARQGLDEYAASAAMRLKELENNRR